MRVSLTGLTKRFGANTANDAVSVDFTSAGVHTLLGENGAGKTTLVRMLAGLLQPDAGTIAIDGTPVAIRSPKEAIALGIALVSQHPVIAGHLTVFENIVTSGALARRGLFDQAALRKRVTEVASSCGIAFDLDRRAEAAGLSVQKHIEIVRALLADARLIIFDEPTDVLTPAESEQFFRLIRRLAASGKTIVLITHFLREAIAHSDSITILRKGRVVASLVPSETSPADLAERMVGALPPVAAASVRELHEGTAIVLSADNVSIVEAGKRAVRNVSLSVRQGEILGIAGVAGNGQEELVEALVGLRAVAEGRIAIDGKTVAPGDTRRLIRSDRLGYVPADRHRDGLAGLMSVSDNLTFEIVERPSLSRLGLLNRSAAAAHAKGLIERFDVQPPAPGLTAERLSGGNQQKLILARVLDRRPSLLVVCNPARGLDVGATRWVWDAIRRVRNENGAVVLLSGDLEEIRSLSDRIAVFFRGAISGELLPAEASSDRLGLLMGGSSDAA